MGVPRSLLQGGLAIGVALLSLGVVLGQNGTDPSATDSDPRYEPPALAGLDWEQPTSHALAAFLGYDSWRGHPDGTWGNNGIHTGINYGTRLGAFSEWTGLSAQIGGSVGVYNWSGTDYKLANQHLPTTQGFVTYGLFRKADDESHWSAAVVQDWMVTDNYSVMAVDATMSQWRAQWGYATSDWNEFGVWGTWRGQSATHNTGPFGPVTWRSINQLNVYWHHKFGPWAPDTWLSLGVPEHERLTGGGSLGDYIIGLTANCPLTDHVALYAMTHYMHPSASAGNPGAREDAWNFYIGLSFYPRPLARSATITGQRWLPQLPVANNGLFFVDASQTY